MQRPPSASFRCSDAGVLCRQAQAACVRATTNGGTGALKWLSMWDENQFRCARGVAGLAGVPTRPAGCHPASS
jgi:hypothetical protein